VQDRDIVTMENSICVHVNQGTHLACNFNCLIENGGLSGVTGSHVYCDSDNVLESVQARGISAKRWVKKNVSEIIYFVSSGT